MPLYRLKSQTYMRQTCDEARMSRRDPRGTDPDTFDRHEFGSTGLRPPWDQSQGFWFCWYSHHPAVEPRTRSARLSSRRALTPRTWTFRKRLFLVRTLVLSYPARARLRTISTREKREVCQWCNTGMFLQETLRLLTLTFFSWKGTTESFLYRRTKVEKPLPYAFTGLAFIPWMNRGAFCSVL